MRKKCCETVARLLFHGGEQKQRHQRPSNSEFHIYSEYTIHVYKICTPNSYAEMLSVSSLPQYKVYTSTFPQMKLSQTILFNENTFFSRSHKFQIVYKHKFKSIHAICVEHIAYFFHSQFFLTCFSFVCCHLNM